MLSPFLRRAEDEVDSQVAAPAETRTAQLAPSEKSLMTLKLCRYLADQKIRGARRSRARRS